MRTGESERKRRYFEIRNRHDDEAVYANRYGGRQKADVTTMKNNTDAISRLQLCMREIQRRLVRSEAAVKEGEGLLAHETRTVRDLQAQMSIVVAMCRSLLVSRRKFVSNVLVR